MDVTGIGTAVTGIKDILGMFFPDKTEQEKTQIAAAFQAMQLQQQADASQNAVNAAAAEKQPITFRDGAGWVCVAAFALAALKSPIEWGCALAGHPVTLPSIDTSETSSMLLGLLGLGGMHLYEQVKS